MAFTKVDPCDLSSAGLIASFFLLPADFFTGFNGCNFGVEPSFPNRPRLSDPAPFSDKRPRAKQSLNDSDDVEPLSVISWLSPFEVDCGHDSFYGAFLFPYPTLLSGHTALLFPSLQCLA